MATEANGEAGSAVGMPQLDFSTWPNQIFWLLVTLVVIYLVLSRIALPRIGAVLADRKSTITNDLAAAEELKQKAVEAEKAYNDALANARTEAAKIIAAAKAEIQKDLDAATAKADAEIAAKTAESEKSIAEIRDGAAAVVAEVARDTAGELVTALGGCAGWLLTRSVVRPLRVAVSVANKVAAGDLTTTIEVDGKDEPARLLEALRTMQENLENVVSGVRSNAEGVASASAEIAQGNVDLSMRTEEQASSLDETTSSMQQL